MRSQKKSKVSRPQSAKERARSMWGKLRGVGAEREEI
jgi:hypothetical protein